MAWQTLTEADVRTRLTGPELHALRSYHLEPGQPSPICDIIAGVVAEIRGRVAGCPRNTLGSGDTIPSELEHAALSLIRWRLIGRLPTGQELIDEVRRKDYEDAQALLRDVAACKFTVESGEVEEECPAGAYGSNTKIAFC